jgi:hypothetical protein
VVSNSQAIEEAAKVQWWLDRMAGAEVGVAQWRIGERVFGVFAFVLGSSW